MIYTIYIFAPLLIYYIYYLYYTQNGKGNYLFIYIYIIYHFHAICPVKIDIAHTVIARERFYTTTEYRQLVAALTVLNAVDRLRTQRRRRISISEQIIFNILSLLMSFIRPRTPSCQHILCITSINV